MTFQPSNFDFFSFVSADYDVESATAEFVYDLGGRYLFRETVTFHGARTPSGEAERAALDVALEHLHLALGVSYYKTAVPREIRVRSGRLPAETADFFSRLYEKGLAEFAYRNGLELAGKIRFPSSAQVRLRPSTVSLPSRAVVPLGGGKDSLVTLELLRGKTGSLSTLTLGEFPVLEALVAEIGLPHIRISRRIDPLLMKLNEAGAYNGHVPFSAILAFLLPVCALLYDFDTAVMSQERSASEGNLVHNGVDVNHQFSKSFEFEQEFASFVNRAVLSSFRYFSLLRPFSELSIAKMFSRLTRYHSLFTSCNRAFRLSNDGTRVRWCCACPKCRFVFLALAPFLAKDRLVEIFGANLLADPAQEPGFRELVGLHGHKPFECVGEIEECRLALRMLIERPEWANESVVRRLAGELRQEPSKLEHGFFEPSDEHIIPAPFSEIVHAAL